ncbi:MarR family transcriptional regulator [Mycobacterium bourgelatii]|uniref:MarR family transcriptional regulator n=2 Tax=Mycobacterium bourgelatii TaxID=1273442 RepID=A0A7I9YLV7_MYCBU|nr:MarR family transcriptional regulator [Mycobacterium bourgelatii]
MSADMRAITAQSDRIGRHFARRNEVSGNDFHALLHIMVAETAGTPLTLAALRQRMDVSPPAITYLVDRMIEAGHIRREPDPADRRKQLLRYEESGMELARSFFTPLGEQLRSAMAELPDRDLQAAHRVFAAMISAMSKFEAQLEATAQRHSSPDAEPATATKVRRRVPQKNTT